MATEMASDISSYGLGFARKHVDLFALVETIQVARFGMPEQLAFRIPVAFCLLGEVEQASQYLLNKLNEIGARTDPATVLYKTFAQRVTEHFNVAT